MASELRLSGLIDESIVDGPGIRYVIFTQGCPHHCPGCHNPQTHDFSGGFDADIPAILDAIREDPLLDGVTLSGGEPFCQAEALLPLVREVKKMGKTVFAYSGYTLEQLLQEADPDRMALLRETDVLVDGPFLLAQRSLELKYCGSRNQRLIDVKKTLSSGVPTLWEPPVW